MGEIVGFASVLAKLVIISSVVLITCSLIVAPDRMLSPAPSMLMLLVPLFVLTTLLDVAQLLRRR
ncbi:hypothetical protein H681_11685 [Pseudomonas sp. ATCC 13867]|uniref:hypothetical protein n=1 Tax=Pseudomonas sp. ATCC 13867 TaxID=1294143 RepID=UPI0002C4F75B|nr:hypothetical protein [Pseudomonas sp. ATCC 13867]AGI24207.1 hypothetical protein H681_11685 [Pseudomonas sp. ATCC 13867]RFQ32548.1 hypothetical protein D0N87_13865 [Pseudomonas sp. ATCC 13867]